MNNELKFDKNRDRVKQCPCGKSNKDGKFAPYVGYDNAGYCHSCDKTFLPEFKPDESMNRYERQLRTRPKPLPPPAFSTIPPEDVHATLNRYEMNNFIQALLKYFGNTTIDGLLNWYPIGTADNGAAIFWQVDNRGLTRTGKVIQYSANTCKRDRSLNPYFIHSQYKDFKHSQCPFGANLLSRYPDAPVNIYESEKAAFIAALFHLIFDEPMEKIIPWKICLATGGANGLRLDKMRMLAGRNVTLFPDLSEDGSTYELWRSYAASFELEMPGTSFKVDDYLEKVATPEQRAAKLDMADFYLETITNQHGKK